MKIILYIFCIILLSSGNSFARDFRNPDKIKHPKLSSYGYGAQLSAEDKYGNLWLYSDGDITKYDGKTFKDLKLPKGQIYTSVTVDKKGNVIAPIYDKSNGKNIYIIKDDKPILLYDLKFLRDFDLRLGSIYFDNNNIPYLYCYFSNHQAINDRSYIYTLKDNKWQSVNKDLGIPDTEDVDLYFFIDSKNRKWVYFRDQINMIDEEDHIHYYHSIMFPDDYNDSQYPDTVYWDGYWFYNSGFLYEDKKGNVWIKANNVLAMFDTKNRWNYYTHRDGIEYNNNYRVNFAENKKGELFLASDKIYKYDFNTDKFISYYQTYGYTATDLSFDYDDNLWISTLTGIEVLKKNGNRIVFTNDLNPAVKAHYVEKVFVDNKNNKWFIFDPEEESTPYFYDNKKWTVLFTDRRDIFDDPVEYKFDKKTNDFVEIKVKSK